MSESTVSEATATAEETNEPAAIEATRLTLAQRQRLLRPLRQTRVKYRGKFAYIPHNDSRAELIKTFGLCGYDLETVDLRQVSHRREGDRITCVWAATVRLTVKDTDGRPLAILSASGAGSSVNQPINAEGDAVDNAIKGAESEAFKRCVINLGDQYGLSLYDGGALESVGGSLVDSPAIQAAASQQQSAPAASQPAPAEQPAPPTGNERDDFETLKQAIRIVRDGDALTRVATRVQQAHVRRLITDDERETLLSFGKEKRKELDNAVPSR